MPTTLKFEIGTQHLSIEVSDKESFIGTLRNMRRQGITAVSSDGDRLVVELSQYCVPTELIADIRRIYTEIKVSPFRSISAPLSR